VFTAINAVKSATGINVLILRILGLLKKDSGTDAPTNLIPKARALDPMTAIQNVLIFANQ
jgi:hypothetical protein